MVTDKKAIASSLDEIRRETVTLAKSLTPQELKMAVHDGAWSVKDVLIHVATSEAGLVLNAKRIAGGQPHGKPGFDIHRFNQGQVEKHQDTSVDELLAILDASRADMHRTLGQMTDAELAAQGFMSSGMSIDVVGVFKRIGDHERDHCREIRQAIGRV